MRQSPLARSEQDELRLPDRDRRAALVPVPAPAVGPLSKPRGVLARTWRPVLLVFLPFVAGYYLSYLFRTINALISANLIADLGLSAGNLGLLTSAYFLSFALAQLPLGVMLDRFGPRRVQSVMLPVAAAGAAVFALAGNLPTLILGRALIGLGVAAALTAGLKAIVTWFPKERLTLVNGCFVMLGSLGAVTATLPIETLLPWIGWRGLFEVLGVATLACALAIFWLTPEAPTIAAPPRRGFGELKVIFSDPRFWRLAPLSMMCISTAWALQGLWVGPWLADVDHLARPEVVRHLFVMALALSAGALVLGFGADRLRLLGLGPQTVLGLVAGLLIATQLALILRLDVSSYLLWGVVASVGAATVLSYSILAGHFPKAMAGQATAALNVFHIGGAFVLQYAFGFILDRWPAHDGHYPLVAYKMALGIILVLQLLALAWFVRRVPATKGMDSEDLSAPAPAIATATNTGRIWTVAQRSRNLYLGSMLANLLGHRHNEAIDITPEADEQRDR
jgi:MFS family permease